MAGDKNLKKAARAIQAECGVKFTTARQWIFEKMDGRPDWSEFNAAAVGLWRRTHGGDGE